MPANHAPAIIRWRTQLDTLGKGLNGFDQSATVSTMLYGCNSWLTHHAQAASPDEVAKIRRIKAELERWLEARGLTYFG